MKNRHFQWVAAAIGIIAALVIARPSHAQGPQNYTIENGSVVVQKFGNIYKILASDGSIMFAESFNIAGNEQVRIFQPSNVSRFLAKITGGEPTSIEGRLRSNGFFYLVNPAGIMFGPNSVVNVGGIVAAAGDISNENFINGVDLFTDLNGNVTNHGTMEALNNGFVHLLGQQIANHGSIIVGDNGIITMVSGDEIRLVPENGRIGVQIEAGADLGSNQTGVTNTGSLRSNGGQITLAAGDLFSLAINNSGEIDVAGGVAQMQAMKGDIEHTGTIVADSAEFEVLDGVVRLGGGDLDGGVASIETTSDQTFDGNVVLIDDVLLVAGGSTVFNGTVDGDGNARSLQIDAASADFNDNVGQTDALENLTVNGDMSAAGDVTVNAALDVNGALDLDGNADQRIEAGDTLAVEGDVTKGTASLTLAANAIELGGENIVAEEGSLTVEGDVTFNGTGEQTMAASELLDVDGNVSKSTDGKLNLDGGSIALSGDTIENQNGELEITITDGGGQGNPTAGGGDIILDGNGDQVLASNDVLDLNGNVIKTTTGKLNLNAGTEVQLEGSITQAQDGELEILGDVNLDGDGDQSIAASTTLDIDGNLEKTTAGNAALNGSNIELSGATIENQNGDLDLNGATEMDGAGEQTVASSATLDINGNVSKSETGKLNLDATTVELAGMMTENQNGELEITGDVVLDGVVTGFGQRISSSETLDIDGNVTQQTGNALTLNGETIELSGDTIQNQNHHLIINGDVNMDGTGEQTVASSATLDINGNVEKSTEGKLNLDGANVELSGTTIENQNGELEITGDVNMDGDGEQTVVSSSTLDIDGNVEKSTEGKLNLDGASIELSGNTIENQNGELEITILGNDDPQAGGGIILLDGDGDQTLESSTTLDINGDVEKIGDGDRLTMNGQTIEISGATVRNENGDVVMNITDGNEEGGGNNVVFDGLGDQSVTSGTLLDINGNVLKTNSGDLTLNGGNIALSGESVTNDDGSLVMNITDENGTIFFDGNGDQTVTATEDVDLNGNVLKSADEGLETANLTLNGTNINLSGATIENTDGSIIMNGTVGMDGATDQRVAAADELIVNGDMTKTESGDLNLAATNGIDLNGDTDNTVGALTIENDVASSGNIRGTGVTLQGNTVMDGVDTQRINARTGMLHAQGTLTKETDGNLVLGGDELVKLDREVKVNNGDLTVDDNAELGLEGDDGFRILTHQGSQTFMGDVNVLTNDLGMFANDNGRIELRGNTLGSGAGTFAKIKAGTVDIDGNAENFGSLTVNGRTNLSGSTVSAWDAINIQGHTRIFNDVDVIGLGDTTITFGDDISAANHDAHKLLVMTDGTARFNGDIGTSNSAFKRFEIDVDGLTEFGPRTTDTKKIHATGSVIFNLDGRRNSEIPRRATVGVHGDFVVNAGMFRMGRAEKLTVLGETRINVGDGTAELSDVNSFGDFRVDAGKINIVLRPGNRIEALEDGVIVRAKDRGTDFVTGGRFFFSVNPNIKGDGKGLVQFANPDGDADALGTLGGFIIRSYSDGEPIKPRRFLAEDIYFDLRADGPSNANIGESQAAAILRDSSDEEADSEANIGANIVRQLLSAIGVEPRPVDQGELDVLASGLGVYNDAGTTRVDFPSALYPDAPTSVANTRLKLDLALRAQANFNALTTDQVAAGRMQQAADAYLASLGDDEQPSPAAFAAFLESADTNALADFQNLRQLVDDLNILGFTQHELVNPIDRLLSRFFALNFGTENDQAFLLETLANISEPAVIAAQ